MELQTRLDSLNDRSIKTYGKKLAKLNIITLEDLFYHIPSRYEDFSLTSKISQLQEGEVATIKGHVMRAQNNYTKRFKTIQKIILADETEEIELTWFNQPYIVRGAQEGDIFSVAGKVEHFGAKKQMISPHFEMLTDLSQTTIHTGRLVPIYHETRGVTSKWLRRKIFQLLTTYETNIIDFLPVEIRKTYQYNDLLTSLWQIHFPRTYQDVMQAKTRFGFEEFFLLQLSSLERKNAWSQKRSTHVFAPLSSLRKRDELEQALPFTLTPSQQNAVEIIINDMNREKPMNRLLQGDVGSGKTIVAALVMYHTYLNGFQSVLMAPTSILAKQHFTTLSNLLSPLGITIGLSIGGRKIKNQHDSFDILIGTHALISETQQFKNVALVVIDEQQRFGVKQRGLLKEKGGNPHLLSMTATPIPRTVALTIYGDLDVTYLHEMPKGRKKVKTWLVPPEKREGAYQWIRTQINAHSSQAFIICPFIEESDNMQTVKAATKEYERLQKEVYPDLKLGLLHGKLKSKEKDIVLNNFRQKATSILVATPVVEVGIDIPNATIIMIEAAERFGLAGLHQLRGRVGRGDKQSYCLLFTEGKSEKTIQRLKALETIYQGSELAEYDLKLRGPGEVYGTRQSGSSLLKIASFSDTHLIDQAKREALNLFPNLLSFPELKKKVNHLSQSGVNPD